MCTPGHTPGLFIQDIPVELETHLGYFPGAGNTPWFFFLELDTHLGYFPGAGHTPGLFLQDTCVELDGALRADGA